MTTRRIGGIATSSSVPDNGGDHSGGGDPSGYIVGVENNDNTTNNLFVVDISDNTSPSVVGNYENSRFRQATSIAAYPSQERIYVCGRVDRRISCINMSDPTSPSAAGSFTTPTGWNPYKIGIVGDVLLVYEHKVGDGEGRLTSYDLTSSLSLPAQIDQVTGNDLYAMQSAWFDNANGRLWMGTSPDAIMVWEYDDAGNLAYGAYTNYPTANVAGSEPIVGYGDKAIYAATANGKFGIGTYSAGAISTSNTGSLGKTSRSNGQVIRLSADGYCYFSCSNFGQTGGFVLPHAQLADDGTTSNLSSSSLTSLSGGQFTPGPIATDNTEDYLYILSSNASATGSSKLLVLDVTDRTSPTEVSTTTLTGYNVFLGQNCICHYNP